MSEEDWTPFAKSQFDYTRNGIAYGIKYGLGKKSKWLNPFVYVLGPPIALSAFLTGHYLLGALMAAGIFSSLWLTNYVPYRHANKVIKSLGNDVSATIEYCPAGIAWTDATCNSKIPWKTVAEVIEVPIGILFRFGPHNLVLIPAAAIPSDDSMKRIKGLIANSK